MRRVQLVHVCSSERGVWLTSVRAGALCCWSYYVRQRRYLGSINQNKIRKQNQPIYNKGTKAGEDGRRVDCSKYDWNRKRTPKELSPLLACLRRLESKTSRSCWSGSVDSLHSQRLTLLQSGERDQDTPLRRTSCII